VNGPSKRKLKMLYLSSVAEKGDNGRTAHAIVLATEIQIANFRISEERRHQLLAVTKAQALESSLKLENSTLYHSDWVPVYRRI
jgi:hypothetical protein